MPPKPTVILLGIPEETPEIPELYWTRINNIPRYSGKDYRSLTWNISHTQRKSFQIPAVSIGTQNTTTRGIQGYEAAQICSDRTQLFGMDSARPLRKPNQPSFKDSYLLPFMNTCIKSFGDAKVFKTLDAYSGYFHMPINPENTSKTAFICKFVDVLILSNYIQTYLFSRKVSTCARSHPYQVQMVDLLPLPWWLNYIL